jgi:hypothetical protein
MHMLCNLLIEQWHRYQPSQCSDTTIATPCAKGTYSIGSATSCTACSDGDYQDSTGQSSSEPAGQSVHEDWPPVFW